MEQTILPELREITFGSWEGLTMSEIQANFPVEVDLWQHDPAKLQIPDGEAYVSAQRRVCGAIRRIVAECLGRQVAVVSHGGVIRLVLAGFLGLPLSGICIWDKTRRDQPAGFMAGAVLSYGR